MSEKTITKSKKKHTVQYDRWGYFFIAPFFLIYLVFSLIPLVMTFVNTFVEQYNVGLEVEGPNFKVPTYFQGQEKFYTSDIEGVQNALNSLSVSGNVDEQTVATVRKTILSTASLMDTSNVNFNSSFDKMAKAYLGKSPKELTDATKAFVANEEILLRD